MIRYPEKKKKEEEKKKKKKRETADFGRSASQESRTIIFTISAVALCK